MFLFLISFTKRIICLFSFVIPLTRMRKNLIFAWHLSRPDMPSSSCPHSSNPLNPLNSKDLFLRGCIATPGTCDVCPWILPVKMTFAILFYHNKSNITNARCCKIITWLYSNIITYIMFCVVITFFFCYTYYIYTTWTFGLFVDQECIGCVNKNNTAYT